MVIVMEANSIVPQQKGEVEKSQLSSFEHREWRKKPLQIELIAAYLPGTGNWLGKQHLKGNV